jgi:hypothetical protein
MGFAHVAEIRLGAGNIVYLRDEHPNRYPRCQPGTNATPTSSFNETTTTAVPEPPQTIEAHDVLELLQRLESRSFSILSAQPLVAHSSPRQPFLGFFEDLPCFPYLTFQLCAWFVFLTFWIFFADFEPFRPVAAIFGPEADSNYGARDHLTRRLPEPDEGQSPTTSVLLFLYWLLPFGPMSSLLYLLLYPRKGWNRVKKLPQPATAFLQLLYCMVFILSPMLTYLYYSASRAIAVSACEVLLYIILTLLLTFKTVG